MFGFLVLLVVIFRIGLRLSKGTCACVSWLRFCVFGLGTGVLRLLVLYL